MSRKTPEALMAKASQALVSAQTLLDLGDADGASNRATTPCLMRLKRPCSSPAPVRGFVQAMQALFF